MKKSKVRQNEENNEAVSSKKPKFDNGNGEDAKEEEDEVTSTLALQHDLKVKISKNPFASRIHQPKRLIVVLENASLETVFLLAYVQLMTCFY